MTGDTEGFFTIDQLVSNLKQKGILTNTQAIEAKIKRDEIDTEILEGAGYLIPVAELERLVAIEHYSAHII